MQTLHEEGRVLGVKLPHLQIVTRSSQHDLLLLDLLFGWHLTFREGDGGGAEVMIPGSSPNLER